MQRRPSLPLLRALALALLASCAVAAASKGTGSPLSVDGKIVLPEGMRVPPETEVTVVLESGRTLLTFPTPDGRFSIAGVPDGVHTLSVHTARFLFPTVKLTVGASLRHPVTATLPELPTAPGVPYPLLMRPMALAEYYETKKPVNIMGFLKTPYGMMALFMVFSLVIMPKLKVDPEEYRQVMSERRGGADSGGGGNRRD